MFVQGHGWERRLTVATLIAAVGLLGCVGDDVFGEPAPAGVGGANGPGSATGPGSGAAQGGAAQGGAAQGGAAQGGAAQGGAAQGGAAQGGAAQGGNNAQMCGFNVCDGNSLCCNDTYCYPASCTVCCNGGSSSSGGGANTTSSGSSGGAAGVPCGNQTCQPGWMCCNAQGFDYCSPQCG